MEEITKSNIAFSFNFIAEIILIFSIIFLSSFIISDPTFIQSVRTYPDFWYVGVGLSLILGLGIKLTIKHYYSK